MAVRTTVDIPKSVHDNLRRRATRSGTSIRALIIRAIELTYGESKSGDYVRGPLVTGSGKLGPRMPVDENPHDLVLS